MKKIKASIIGIGIVVFLVLLSTVSAVGATVVKVDPASQPVAPGQGFSVNVTVEGVTSMGADQATLNFDPNAMSVTGVTEGDFLKTAGATIGAGFEIIDPTNGYVTFSYALTTHGANVTGSGTLATINFDTNASVDNVFDLNLTDVVLADGYGAPITVDEVSNGTVTITGAAEIHDINVTTDYSPPTGIRIKEFGGADISHSANLTIGKEYWIMTEVKNEGTVDETAYETITVTNETDAAVFGPALTPEKTINVGGSEDYKKKWSTNGLTPGYYTIFVNASIVDYADEHPENNNRTRIVGLEIAAVDTTAPTTNVTIDTTPIPSGEKLPWTNEDVVISFRRTDNGGGNPSGVNYTNLSAQTQITNVDVNGTTMTIPQIGAGNLTINTTAFGETFNVTISNELNTKIYYYSVDKNETPNVEDTKNLTVRIDKTAPDIISVELNKTSVNASEPINVSVDVTDALSGIANVTADSVKLTKQNGNWWNGTITAVTAQGLHNVTVIAYDNASNMDINNTVQYEVRAGAPSIIGYAPGSPVYDNEGATRRFNITIDQIANVTWLINGTQVGFNDSVTEANYTNTSAEIGTWNVSAVVENANGTTMQTWIWHVLPTGESWFTVHLEPDYELISVPLNDTSITDAQSLINKINAQGGNCIELISWNGTAWLSYVPPDDPLNNVTIKGGEGYFVHVTVESDVTFTGTAWKN